MSDPETSDDFVDPCLPNDQILVKLMNPFGYRR